MLPEEDHQVSEEGTAQWKSYFDEIFGKVDVKAINDFALKYKMSAEEETDVLANYEKFKGDLTKMLHHVMLSEERDCIRWMEDYIKPAVECGKARDHLERASKALKRIRVKLSKELATVKRKADDPGKASTEGAAEETRKESKRQATLEKKGFTAKTKSAKVKKSSDDDALVATIRARFAEGNPLAALAARYGVSMDDDDPLDDKAFASLQNKNKGKK